MKMGFSGMGSVKGKQHSGITAMFNFRANHKLGPKRVAVHRIPVDALGAGNNWHLSGFLASRRHHNHGINKVWLVNILKFSVI
jgi:hypothetical protein